MNMSNQLVKGWGGGGDDLEKEDKTSGATCFTQNVSIV
jgi:hypothetical protein